MDNQHDNLPVEPTAPASPCVPTPDDDVCLSASLERRRRRRVLNMAGRLITTVALLLVGAMIALLVVPNAWMPRLTGEMASADKLSLLKDMVRSYYINGDELDDETMSDAMAAAYIYGLGDPYSAYFSKEELSQVVDDNLGNSSGIGISASYDDDPPCIFIARVYKDSPAAFVGIRKRDRITAVDGEAVTAANYNRMIAGVRGKAGTTVTLTVLREGETFDVTATRADFVIESVFSRTVGNVGVIEVTEFNQATDDQFREAVDALEAQGVAGLIVDLRGNRGGLMDVATDMLDRLLPAGELGYAVYSGGRRETIGRSGAGAVDLPLAVLVDGNTASAAEYFASAMRDSGGAVLVGETTFGKGIMQTTYPLGDGTAVRLTVAKFYTASGTEFHGIGLAPDVDAAPPEGVNRLTLTDEEDPVLQAALAALK